MTNLDSVLKGRDITLPTKVHLVKAIIFPVVMYGCESWTIKKAECRRTDAFELWCWRRLLRVPWTARRTNQSILKEINPEDSWEGLMLKLQYFGHLMPRADSLEKTLMLGKIEGRRRKAYRGQDGWMGSLTQWTWVWASSRRWWRTGKPSMLQSMGPQRVGHDWAINNKVQASHLDQLDLDSLKKSILWLHLATPRANEVQVGYSLHHFPTLWVGPTPTSKHPTSNICRGGTHPASQTPRLGPSVSISQCGRGSLRFPYGNVWDQCVNPSPILVNKLQHEMLELEGLRKHLLQLSHEGTEAQEGGDLIPHKAAPNYYLYLLQQQGAWVNEG